MPIEKVPNLHGEFGTLMTKTLAVCDGWVVWFMKIRSEKESREL